MEKQISDCPYCGPVPTNHFISRAVLIVDRVSSPMNGFFMFCTRMLGKLIKGLGIKNFGIYFFKLLSKIRLVKIVDSYDKKNSDRAICMWQAANRRGIKVYEIRIFGRSTELFWCEYKGNKLLFEGLPRTVPLSSALEWMDNKAIMREKLEKAGFPIAKGAVCRSYSEALKIFNSIGTYVITKPHVGSRSRHTTIHIDNEKKLKEAFKIAKALSPWVIVEQELKGTVHRVTLIGQKLVAVMRRDPPFVIGDGTLTLKQLVEQENKNPKRQGPHFHHIPMDEFSDQEIERQGFSWDDLIPKDKTVVIRNNIGRSSGGSNSDVTAQVHPKNVELFEKIAHFVDDSVFGMDFIISDISKTWTEQMPCGVIEINSVPFLDLHQFPLYGNPIDASDYLWDVVFPESGLTSSGPR